MARSKQDTPKGSDQGAVDLMEPPAGEELDPTAHTEQLQALREEIVAELPPPPARPTPTAPTAAGEDDDDGVDVLVEEITELGDHPEKAASFTAEEWADLWGLAFGVTADGLGPHWEIAHKRALRLGHYTQKSIARYGGDPEKIGRHMPLIALALLACGTIFGKVMLHRRLTKHTPVLELHQGGATETASGEVRE